MKLYKVRNSGFTFTEVLMVIAILGIMAGLAIPFYQSFQISSQVDNTTQEIISTLRWAQARAMSSESLSSFGIHFESQRYVLFKGDIYNSADPSNEPISLSDVLSVNSGAGVDIIFTAISGTTTNTGLITVSATSGKPRTITINEHGVINAL